MDQLIKELAKQLRLPYLSQNIKLHLEQARIENKSYEEFLLELLQYEVQLRHQNRILSRIRNAKFPYQKILEELDVVALPQGVQSQYHQLCSLDFIKKQTEFYFIWKPRNW